jgi:hypothetical protein
VRIHRSLVSLVYVGLSCAVVAGCGAEESDATEGPNTLAFANIPAGENASLEVRRELVPERVTVTQPALVDINARAADLPVWPGPDPSEFLAPNPPAGEIGQLSGAQAGEALIAAQNNPGEFWNVGGIVLWLVVAPVQ